MYKCSCGKNISYAFMRYFYILTKKRSIYTKDIKGIQTSIKYKVGQK
jgi:hypothetical protein